MVATTPPPFCQGGVFLRPSVSEIGPHVFNPIPLPLALIAKRKSARIPSCMRVNEKRLKTVPSIARL